PVSWLLIRPGWKLLSVDGHEVGEVDEVAGDDTEDIFDGLAIATNALGKPRYVPAEQVAEITEGIVHLSLTREQVEELGEYLEPATTAEIEPDSKGGTGAELGAPRSRSRVAVDSRHGTFDGAATVRAARQPPPR